ncbi:MAG TPA: hypothetical protein VFE57_11215 [Cyclobacteriaceae bacterium]|jgi:hypothetical protein|nr:hypothetical protein [Cyclobacteriaceae bacterium]
MKTILLLFFFLISSSGAFAQCAMCSAVLENNLSNGNVGIAAGINFGIMYLFFAPYLAVLVVGYFWYKTSKNARINLGKSAT